MCIYKPILHLVYNKCNKIYYHKICTLRENYQTSLKNCIIPYYVYAQQICLGQCFSHWISYHLIGRDMF